MNQVLGQKQSWEVVIGLEIHAQISSKLKLFSKAPTLFGADPNTQVDLLDLGLPGILPVINQECVDQGILTSFGLNGVVHPISVFDRKNYFYADLPTGYQISQYRYPLMTNGYIDIGIEGEKSKRIRINRLHLEQDAGKSTHDLDATHSYIDLNRAGVALMEIVSEPDLSNSKEVAEYVKKIRTILRYLGTCDGNMDEGSLRVDANVSVRLSGTPLGTRTEIKNLNSIRFLMQAIDYEVERHIDILESGGAIVQETRLYDSLKNETRPMRSKEDAHDYRYFPDPDLPPIRLSPEYLQKVRAKMCELPGEKKRRFMEVFGLSAYDASVLTDEKERADYYDILIERLPKKDASGKIAANWLISEVFGFMNKHNTALKDLPFTVDQLGELISLILNEVISGKIAKTIFTHMWETGKNPKDLLKELGIEQISDANVIKECILNVLKENPKQLEDYKNGKEQLFGFFVGSVMKKLKSQANPPVVNDVLKETLKNL